jgi:hypothetical protein
MFSSRGTVRYEERGQGYHDVEKVGKHWLKQWAPWSRVLCEKLEASQLVTFHTLYGTWKFHTVFARAHHLSLSQARISSACHCILFFWDLLCRHLHLGLPSGFVPSGFLTKLCMQFSSHHICCVPCPSHHPSFDHLNNTGWRVQIMKLLRMWFCPVSRYFCPPKEDNMSQIILDILLCGCMCTALLPQYAFSILYFSSVYCLAAPSLPLFLFSIPLL